MTRTQREQTLNSPASCGTKLQDESDTHITEYIPLVTYYLFDCTHLVRTDVVATYRKQTMIYEVVRVRLPDGSFSLN